MIKSTFFLILILCCGITQANSVFEEKTGLLKYFKSNHYSFYRIVKRELVNKKKIQSRGLASKSVDLKKDLAQFYIKSFIKENPNNGLKELEKNIEFLKIYFSKSSRGQEKSFLVSSLEYLWENKKLTDDIPLRAFQVFEVLTK